MLETMPEVPYCYPPSPLQSLFTTANPSETWPKIQAKCLRPHLRMLWHKCWRTAADSSLEHCENLTLTWGQGLVITSSKTTLSCRTYITSYSILVIISIVSISLLFIPSFVVNLFLVTCLISNGQWRTIDVLSTEYMQSFLHLVYIKWIGRKFTCNRVVGIMLPNLCQMMSVWCPCALEAIVVEEFVQKNVINIVIQCNASELLLH